jgi:alkanesulfonate monooxygenase SsuD/methylene tetrahydromethanopterin reductase-like flavin-dependent oxidoreductase (luciferase family)
MLKFIFGSLGCSLVGFETRLMWAFLYACRKYFNVAGPHLIEPSRQRTPFIFQAGASQAGKVFATKHAEAMFLPGMHIESVRKSVLEIRQTAVEQGRDINGLKLIVSMLIIVDETDELAQRKYDEYLSYADLDGSLALFGGWTGQDLGPYSDDDDFQFTGPGAIQSIVSSWRATIPGSEGVKWTKRRVAQELALGGPHPRAIGSAKTVADILEKWVAETDVDGFNISYAVGPGDLEDVVRYLVPELKARGVFWDPITAEGKTTRENYLGDFANGSRLSSDHPGSKYRWAASDDGQ